MDWDTGFLTAIITLLGVVVVDFLEWRKGKKKGKLPTKNGKLDAFEQKAREIYGEQRRK